MNRRDFLRVCIGAVAGLVALPKGEAIHFDPGHVVDLKPGEELTPVWTTQQYDIPREAIPDSKVWYINEWGTVICYPDDGHNFARKYGEVQIATFDALARRAMGDA